MYSATEDDLARDHLWALVRRIRFALLTSRDAEGHLHARPLTTQNKLDQCDCTLYFFIAADSGTARDVENDSRVGVIYADPDDGCYVSASCKARVTRQPQRQAELWSAAAQAWFAGGPDDERLRLLEVQIIEAEYWDAKSSKLMRSLKLVAANLSGKTGDAPGGEHREVRMG